MDSLQASAIIPKVERLFAAAPSRILLQPVPGLTLLRVARTTQLEASVYQPVICLILQGRKETMLGERTLRFGAGESLIVSHELPVLSRIIEADAQLPYLAVVLNIDIGLLRSLYEQVAEHTLPEPQVESMAVHQTEPQLMAALSRYLELIEHPLEAQILAPLLLKEIHFRLLMAAHGGMLRRLLRQESHPSRIARALEHLRQHFASPLSVPELARHVGMSPSSFYQHFKTITGNTPLQYQKDLRLLEAKSRLMTGGQSVSRVALDVGYESPTQFSREYARKFGASPRHDRP